MTGSSAAAGIGAALLLSSAALAAPLQIAIDNPPAGLDPHIVTAFASAVIVQGNVYEGLTAVTEDLSIVPGLAESWETSQDGLTYTFQLKPGVTFHDGSAMDADDVAASIRRVQAEATGSPLASRVAPIASVEAIDPQTVALTLSEPFAPILTALSGIAIVPAEYEENVEALQQAPVGTGPFAFSQWVPNGYIELTAFADYHEEGQPTLEALRFNFVPEAATRQAGILSGDYHMLPAIDPATALQLQGQPGVTVQETRDLAYTLIGFNVRQPPFDDPRVRTAFNLMLDRQEIIDGALFGAGVPAGPLSPALTAWALDTAEFPCYATDREAAMALLAEAGVETPVALTMNVLPRQDTRDIAQIVQQQVADGFAIELVNQELGQFVQDWRAGNFDLFVSANAGSPDPDDYFYRTFYGGGSTNVFGYADPEIDALLDEGRSAGDPATRKAAYDAVQRQFACEGPAAHIAYANLSTAVSDGLTGFTIHPNGRLTGLAGATLAE